MMETWKHSFQNVKQMKLRETAITFMSLYTVSNESIMQCRELLGSYLVWATVSMQTNLFAVSTPYHCPALFASPVLLSIRPGVERHPNPTVEEQSATSNILEFGSRFPPWTLSIKVCVFFGPLLLLVANKNKRNPREWPGSELHKNELKVNQFLFGFFSSVS